MKLDTKRLISRYVILSEEGLSKNDNLSFAIYGPVEEISYIENGILLKTKEYCSDIVIDIDENGETKDIEFISQYLWRAMLYYHEHHKMTN